MCIASKRQLNCFSSENSTQNPSQRPPLGADRCPRGNNQDSFHGSSHFRKLKMVGCIKIKHFHCLCAPGKLRESTSGWTPPWSRWNFQRWRFFLESSAVHNSFPRRAFWRVTAKSLACNVSQPWMSFANYISSCCVLFLAIAFLPWNWPKWSLTDFLFHDIEGRNTFSPMWQKIMISY